VLSRDLLLNPRREETELREYLGERFEIERLRRYQDQLDAEFATAANEAAFYRTSMAYLYDLTAFAMSGTKLPYLRVLVDQVQPPARILDYGCGIGSDGLVLLEAGYRVEFADFDNPSLAYLRWRLEHRGLEAPVHDLDTGVPDGYELAFAFDVIEHVDDPFGFLQQLERRAQLVEVNFLERAPDDPPLHRDLPIGQLLNHAAHHQLRFYRRLHGRSHLVVYGAHGRATGGLEGLRIRAALMRQLRGRPARRLPRAGHPARRR
jgi:SAM-dependent methyltransferase